MNVIVVALLSLLAVPSLAGQYTCQQQYEKGKKNCSTLFEAKSPEEARDICQAPEGEKRHGVKGQGCCKPMKVLAKKWGPVVSFSVVPKGAGSGPSFNCGGDMQQAKAPGKPQPPVEKMGKEQCAPMIANLKKDVDACLKRKKYAKRKKCVERKKPKYDGPKFDACREYAQPVIDMAGKEEKNRYPKQASAFMDDHGDKGQMKPHDHHQPGHKGVDHKEHGHKPPHKGKMMAKNGPECDKHVPKLEKKVRKCLKRKKFERRAQCFQKVGDSFPREMFDSCGEKIEPIKQKVIAKENSMYPKQGSALAKVTDGGGPEPHHKDHKEPKDMADHKDHGKDMAKVDCAMLEQKVRKEAEKCLGVKNAGKRKSCVERIGEKIGQNGGDQCGEKLEPIKEEFARREKEKYPREPASFED